MLSCLPVAAAEPPGEPTVEIAKEHARVLKSDLALAAHRLGEAVDLGAQDAGSGWLDQPWWLGVSAARYLAAALILTAVGLLTGLIVRQIRKRAGRIDNGGIRTWPRLVLTSARKPLAMILWIYGVYFALGILFDAMPPDAPPAAWGGKLVGLTFTGLTAAIFWLAFRLIRAGQKKMEGWADRRPGITDNIIVPIAATALRLATLVTGVYVLIGTTDPPPPLDWMASKLAAMFAIGCVARLIIRSARVAEGVLLKAHRMDVADNLKARQIYTQVSVIRKVIVVCAGALAVACMLMLFEPVRQLGTSILASAGIAGIVLGLAAQKTLSNLFAGIQIAVSQPIRIDDVVIVEGEWGKIEEISLTFVTVCIWDLRRLVLPINYFIEKPFQNWTRNSATLLNSVFIYSDYTLPVEPLRRELRRLLEANPLWDGGACVLQVTDSTPQAMEIRCLMTSSDAPKGWDLKCEVREGLVTFIRENYPECLPRVRAEVRRDGVAPVPVAASASGPASGTGESSPGLAVR
ncbi:mechanosensitive ion channel family protein [Luteolibacter marinus]|uniref:mechanosensitive ion channel family protein n=1 Tax=Luteolibacter marinus TaxID=2776705 RepID=UPI001866863C|nr:mechanosensitive ion channel domain-containing protein [Luteolibacter marinus]